MAADDNSADRSEDGSGVVELQSAWATVGLSVLSGVLMALSMPNFNLWPLAWIGLVPLLTALYLRHPGPTFLYVLPCALLWWLAGHIWYPDGYRPTVQVIDNFVRNHKLGLIAETKVGKGKMLICAIDLLGQQDKPAARQLLHSLLRYLDSAAFAPKAALDADLLKKLLPHGQ